MDNNMLNVMGATNIQKGLLVMAAGILGVFMVLILFFILMKVIIKLLPYKESKDDDALL